MNYNSSKLKLCDVKRSGCGRAYPESFFAIRRDGAMCSTIICANCIARLNVEQNKQQSARKRKEARRLELRQSQLKLPLPPTMRTNMGTADGDVEFLLRESIKQAAKKGKGAADE